MWNSHKNLLVWNHLLNKNKILMKYSHWMVLFQKCVRRFGPSINFFLNFNTFRVCRVGRSRHGAHFCNLNLTFFSYSFWNITRKVLKFKKKLIEGPNRRTHFYSWVVLFQICFRHFRTPTKMAATTELNLT
jgi:hypothetical protein